VWVVNDRKISVIIRNPPYNAGQDNFNLRNSNYLYQQVDQQIKNEASIAAGSRFINRNMDQLHSKIQN
jgi:predicted helicase